MTSITKLNMLAADWAEEEARKDLAFVGDAPWQGITPEQRAKLESALIHYARMAAGRTVLTLNLHGHLTPN